MIIQGCSYRGRSRFSGRGSLRSKGSAHFKQTCLTVVAAGSVVVLVVAGSTVVVVWGVKRGCHNAES